MLRLSKKADYAIFLLCYLAQRGSAADSPDEAELMSAAELSETTGLSHSLVANLLKDYTRAGVLRSVRGQHGGYRLAKAPGKLSLRDLLSVVEGPINFVECAETLAPEWNASAEPSCGLAGICPSKGPLQVLHNRIVNMLESLTLAELAQFSALHGHSALSLQE